MRNKGQLKRESKSVLGRVMKVHEFVAAVASGTVLPGTMECIAMCAKQKEMLKQDEMLFIMASLDCHPMVLGDGKEKGPAA